MPPQTRHPSRHLTGLMPRLRLIESLPRDAARGERRWDIIPSDAGVDAAAPVAAALESSGE